MIKKSILLLALFLGIQSNVSIASNVSSISNETVEFSVFSPECFEEAEEAAQWLMDEWLGDIFNFGTPPPSDEDMYDEFIRVYDECEAANDYDEFQFPD